MLKKEAEVYAFLKDLCTPREIEAMQERWRICQCLQEKNHSYRRIQEMTGASLTTVGRVARFLYDEPHKGYQMVLDRLAVKKE